MHLASDPLHIITMVILQTFCKPIQATLAPTSQCLWPPRHLFGPLFGCLDSYSCLILSLGLWRIPLRAISTMADRPTMTVVHSSTAPRTAPSTTTRSESATSTGNTIFSVSAVWSNRQKSRTFMFVSALNLCSFSTCRIIDRFV